jgi:uncharacterized RDD family membrane protein YckC
MEENIIKEENNENKEFLIYPSKLSRRLLTFLADGFLAFILCIFLFEIVVLPLGKLSVNYGTKYSDYVNVINERYDFLYSNNYLFYENENTKYSYNSNVEYTANEFIHYYAFDKDVSLKKYEIFENYYVNKKGLDENTFLQNKYKYESSDSFKKYFEIDLKTSPYTIQMRETYRNLFKPYFETENAISDAGKKEMTTFKSQFFQGTFLGMTNDLYSSDNYIIGLNNDINTFKDYQNNLYIYCSYISFVLVVIILYLIIPLIDKKGRTVGKIIMKQEVINTNTLQNPHINLKISLFFLNTLESLSFLMFVPWISAGFSTLFSLVPLFYPSAIALLYCLISFVIACANTLNKSIKELVTFTMVVDSSLMDQYYIERGYSA